MQLVNQALS